MVPLVKISLWDYKSIAKQLVFLKATSRSQNRHVKSTSEISLLITEWLPGTPSTETPTSSALSMVGRPAVIRSDFKLVSDEENDLETPPSLVIYVPRKFDSVDILISVILINTFIILIFALSWTVSLL